MPTGIINSAGAVLRNSLKMESAHFLTDLSHQDALELFQRHVELIEVETTSYCNRTCSFCPNSFIDRRSEQFTMPEATWQAILGGLQECNYDQTFIWSRYSEPLSERRILDRIKDVRRAAPKCRIAVNSNGDYLDSGYLDELHRAGLDRLMVDIYMPDEEEYNDGSAKKFHDKFLKRIDKTATIVRLYPELSARVDYPMDILTNVRNTSSLSRASLVDRGGLIQLARKNQRVSPCYTPYKHLVIDWDGSIVVCCQVRSDSTTHKDAVVGKIGAAGVGLIDAYVKLGHWRLSLKTFDAKHGPCATCEYGAYSSTVITRTLSRVLSDIDLPFRNLLQATFKPLLSKRTRW